MLGQIIRDRCYCGIDIGSQKIKASILKVRDAHHMELLGVFERNTYGFKNASVNDLGVLSEVIHDIIQELMKKTGVKFKEVYLGVGGELIDIRETNTMIPLIDKGNKIIAKHDIKKVNEQARLLSIKMEEEILHDLPQYYIVDDINPALNPRGLYGRKLGVHSLMIIANANRIRNLIRAINQAGYDVSDVFFSSYAAGDIALSDQERAQGCVLIDVGSTTTSILVFKENVLKYLHKINLGGDDLTRCIANQLNLSLDLAEEIKKSYATAIPSDRYQDEEILVKRDNTYMPVKRKVICQSIEPEIKKLIEKMYASIEDSRLADQMNRGMVLIGGGALLSGLIERIGHITNLPARLGKINIATKRSLGNAALFSSVVGVAKDGFKKSFGYTISSNGHTNWTQRVTNRIRELYQEYF